MVITLGCPRQVRICLARHDTARDTTSPFAMLLVLLRSRLLTLLLCCCVQGIGVFDMPLPVPIPMHPSVPTLVLQGVRVARVEII